MEEFKFRPIGIIHTPYKNPAECPRQGFLNHGVRGSIEILPQFQEGLLDLDGFSHILLIWVFDKSENYSLLSKPPGEEKMHGVFATRSPHRPNPLGLTVVKLTSIDRNILHIEDPDMVDGTPLLDIKPYVLPPDTLGEVKRGWLDSRK
jgi:tRNA-Thr(GGU) m(6)t(6)A37 methyltransferase TsaA